MISMDDLWGYAVITWISAGVFVMAFWAIVEILK